MGLSYPPSVSHPYFILPDGWNNQWLSAKANAASTPARVFIDGDSIAGGAYCTWAQGYGELLAAALQSSLGHYGDFYAAINNTSSAIGAGCPWSMVSESDLAVWNGTCSSSSTAAAALQTFTTPYNVTAMTAYYYNPAAYAGTWQYSVDGGANQTVTNAQSNTISTINITGLSSGIHTFAWGWQSFNYTASILGVDITVPGATGGVRIARHQQVGHVAGGFNVTSSIPGSGGWTGWPRAADLCIFEDMVNDVSAGTALTTFGNSIDQKIRAMRRQQPNCSIIYILPCVPNDPSGNGPDDYNASWTNAATAWQYHTQIIQLARHHNVAIFDAHAYFGSSGLSSVLGTTLHPNATGHLSMYSNGLAPIVL